MITGFFYHQTVEKGNENKQIIKIIKLCLLANLLFFCYRIFLVIFNNESILLWLKETFSINKILEFIVLNESPVAGHLWYLTAILYVLVIMKFVNKYNKYNIIFIITPLLLTMDLLFGKYSLLIFKRNIPFILVRNFLFVGLPYFTIGIYINNLSKSEKFKKLANNKKLLIVLIIFFTITTIIERSILIHFNANAVRDHYISTTFLAIFLFVYFLGVKNKTNNKIIEKIAELGRKYSTNIYIFHYLIRFSV